jgi:hypothetical protein|tara:strand:- start:59 stop:598 length:540 start_codon:yes stop_codon:yes gene_type:complete
MPVTQTIKDFYQVAQTRDFTRNFQFRVTDVLDRGQSILTPDDLVYITTAELPARTVANKTVPYMGLSFNLPGAASYPGSDGYQITFRSDMEQGIRRIFENWQRSIFDDRTSTGSYRIFSSSRIVLDLLDQNFNTMRQYVLHGVWPQNVGNISYDLAGDGDIVTFQTTIAFQYWTRGIIE